MKTLTRAEGITLIAGHEMETMMPKKREATILCWWSIDESRAEYSELSDRVKEDMQRSKKPVDFLDSDYDIFIIFSYREHFQGVKNSFIKSKLEEFLSEEVEVEGEVEQLEHCNCCCYRTLEGTGNGDICPVCFWEDDGIFLPEAMSEANGMTLQQGRDNFEEFGACNELVKNFVSKDDPAEKYFE